MSEKRSSQRPLHVISRTGQIAKVTLADGFRFVILVRDEPPTLVPITEPGSYEIDIPELLAKGKWPVAITTVDLAEVPMFLKIKPQVVERLLDAVSEKGVLH